jgi:hypothetical protein
MNEKTIEQSLLAVASAILLRLNRNTSQTEINGLAEYILKERVNLFTIRNTSTTSEMSIEIDINPNLDLWGSKNITFPIKFKRGEDPVMSLEKQKKN